MERYGKVWKSMEKYGKVWKSMEMYGNVWKCMVRYVKGIVNSAKNRLCDHSSNST